MDSFGFAEVPEFLQVQMEQLITMQTDHISVRQHFGTWYPIDRAEIDGKTYFLLEHEEYGDEAANIIVDEKGILYAQDVYDGFSEEIEDLLKLYSAPIAVMPDLSVSVEDMKNYGYTFLGMVPMGAEAASELRKHGDMMVYALHPDGSRNRSLTTINSLTAMRKTAVCLPWTKRIGCGIWKTVSICEQRKFPPNRTII